METTDTAPETTIRPNTPVRAGLTMPQRAIALMTIALSIVTVSINDATRQAEIEMRVAAHVQQIKLAQIAKVRAYHVQQLQAQEARCFQSGAAIFARYEAEGIEGLMPVIDA